MSLIETIAALPDPPAPAADPASWLPAAWDWLRAHQLTRWTIPTTQEGDGLPASEVLLGMLELAQRQLAITFVLSQFQAAASRIGSSSHQELQTRLLPQLAAGAVMATVGISHLTTSRQRGSRPAVELSADGSAWRLAGAVPWVTAAEIADVIVTGAVDSSGTPRLFVVPTDRQGVTIEPPAPLLALTETGTARVALADVVVSTSDELTFPAEPHAQPSSSGPGSLTTSALALGQALSILDALRQEIADSPHGLSAYTALNAEAHTLRQSLIDASQAAGVGQHTPETLRAATTSLAIRAAQTLVTASRGSGFVSGHPAERLMRESLFFLVWSCPQGVASRLIDEFSHCDRS